MLKLAAQFVPAADEVHRLQSGADAECRLFQKVAEQGHYAGRTRPSNTRQGTYAAAPSGVMLASINSNDPERVAEMLQRALAAWKTLPEAERLLPGDAAQDFGALRRNERFYPEGGLILRVNSRDLPREPAVMGRGAKAWNQDFAWFTSEEARQLIPENPEAGRKREVPRPLVSRIARCHFVDNVRGQTFPYAEVDLKTTSLTSEVTAVDGAVVSLLLEGETSAASDGIWSVSGYRDMDSPTPQKRGMELRLRGHAKYDIQQRRFTEFELVAAGTRWGGTTYNGRGSDLEPAPIGFSMVLAGEGSPRVAPAFLSAYGWR